MLKRFSVKRYRNVEADGLQFRRVTVLVGPNNGGKSNLIDALRFYSDAEAYEGKGNAFHGIIEKRGYGEILRRSVQPPSTIEMRWEHQIQGDVDFLLEIEFGVGRSETFPAGFRLIRDHMRLAERGTDRYWAYQSDAKNPGKLVLDRRPFAGVAPVTTTVDIDPQDLVVAQSKNWPDSSPGTAQSATDKGFPEDRHPLFFEAEIRNQAHYVGSALSPKQISASAARNLSILTLDPTGSELVNVLNNLERRHNDFLDPFTERVREMLPGLEKTRIDDVSDQYKSLRLKIDGQWFRLDELSEGTLKILALGLLLFTPEKASLLSIDEPELNLHPAWLRLLGKWILTARGADQVLISTHSPDLLDALTDGFRAGDVALIVCDPRKGFHNVEAAALDSFFADGWDLGDLYRVGEPALGGWPW